MQRLELAKLVKSTIYTPGLKLIAAPIGSGKSQMLKSFNPYDYADKNTKFEPADRYIIDEIDHITAASIISNIHKDNTTIITSNFSTAYGLVNGFKFDKIITTEFKWTSAEIDEMASLVKCNDTRIIAYCKAANHPSLLLDKQQIFTMSQITKFYIQEWQLLSRIARI